MQSANKRPKTTPSTTIQLEQHPWTKTKIIRITKWLNEREKKRMSTTSKRSATIGRTSLVEDVG